MTINDSIWLCALIGGLMGGFMLGCAFAKWYIYSWLKKEINKLKQPELLDAHEIRNDTLDLVLSLLEEKP